MVGWIYISTFQIGKPTNLQRRKSMLIREKRITTMTGKSMLILVTSLAVGLIPMLVLWLMTSTVTAQQPDVVTLISKDLKEIPGKEVLMITVEYPPGGSDPVHTHDAHGFIVPVR